MARLTAAAAFNSDTFDLSSHFAASGSRLLEEGPFRIGLRSYDDRLTVTDSTGDRHQLLAYLDDTTTEGSGAGVAITGGTVGNLQFNVGFGATGWSPAFRLSSVEIDAVSLVAVMNSASSVDDRSLLALILSDDDTIALSNVADKMDGFAGDDWIGGYNGNDTLLGNSGMDTIDGGIGNDQIQGNTDNDNLNGGRGNDTVNGGTGTDIVRGGSGADTLIGGGDGDIFDFKRTDGHDVISDYNDSQDLIRIDVSNPAAPGWVETQNGDNVVITLTGVSGFSITILNEEVEDITSGDFIFV